VEPLRYRPRRRAVLRVRVEGHTVLFAKVVTPRKGRQLLTVAQALRTTGLPLALPEERVAPGALLLPVLRGTSLRELMVSGGTLPAPERVAALTEELHQRCASVQAPWSGEHRSARRHVDAATALGAAQVVARLLPEFGCTAGRVAEAVIGCEEEDDPHDERIVHGDLYESQVLVDGETLGLLDLDDLGPGDPLLDAANCSAHLLVLGTSGPPAAGTILRYREELRAAFCRRLDADPAALGWREAYCLLRLASGPFRVLHPDWPRRMADRLTLAGRALRR
jgi:hypothetical protein